MSTEDVNPQVDSADGGREQREKQHQVSIDFFKHLTTLSSGGVLLTATLYDKLKDLFNSPKAVVVCIALLFGALVASLIGHWIFVRNFGDKATNKRGGVIGICLLISSLCFVGAFGTLLFLLLCRLF